GACAQMALTQLGSLGLVASHPGLSLAPTAQIEWAQVPDTPPVQGAAVSPSSPGSVRPPGSSTMPLAGSPRPLGSSKKVVQLGSQALLQFCGPPSVSGFRPLSTMPTRMLPLMTQAP